MQMTNYFLCGLLAFTVVNASPAFAKEEIGEIFGALIGVTTGKPAASRANIEQAIFKLCDKVNQLLPMAVDKETRLDNLTPGFGRLTYNYTFINIDADSININRFLQIQTQQLRSGVCSSKDMEIFLKNFITIAYSYRTRDGVNIGKIEITPKDCGLIPF